jgi:hypothetical protein
MSTDSKDSAVFQEGDDGEFVRVNSNDLWIRREKKEKKDKKKPREYPRRQLDHPYSTGGHTCGAVGVAIAMIALGAFMIAIAQRTEAADRVTAGLVCFTAVLGASASWALAFVFDELKVLTDQNKKLRARVHELEQKAGVPESNKKKSV